MQQDSNQQLNNEVTEPTDAQGERVAAQTDKKNKLGKALDIALWVMIAILVVAVLVRTFVYTNITIDGDSMTSAYYNTEGLSSYNPKLTYHNEQVVRVIKVAKPKRGDVVVFYEDEVDSKFKAMFNSDKYKKLIKRVVALEGDKLWIEQDTDGSTRLVIQTASGDKLYEDYYTKGDKTLSAEAFVLSANDKSEWKNLEKHTEDNPLVVSKGYFYVMGDNRTNSRDSRAFGEVSLDKLYGVVWEK